MNQSLLKAVAEFPERGAQWGERTIRDGVSETGDYVRDKPAQSSRGPRGRLPFDRLPMPRCGGFAVAIFAQTCLLVTARRNYISNPGAEFVQPILARERWSYSIRRRPRYSFFQGKTGLSKSPAIRDSPSSIIPRVSVTSNHRYATSSWRAH